MIKSWLTFPLQYVTKMMEVDSPHTLKALMVAESRNEVLMEQLASQAERCHQMTEQLRSSEERTVGLRHKVRRSECE